MNLKIINKRNNELIGDKIISGDTMLLRFVGLMGKKSLNDGEGLLLIPCNSIHMMFMKISLDIVFINKNNTIIHLIENIKPWRISPIIFKSHSVLELPVNSIKSKDLKINDELEIIKN